METMLAILNKSWKQHPTKQQLYRYLPTISKISKKDEEDTRDMLEKQGLTNKRHSSMEPYA